MPSENSITTTEPLRGARTRRPATARDPRPSFRSTTCTGVTLARSIVESTGQLGPDYLNGQMQVREMSAYVRFRSSWSFFGGPGRRSRLVFGARTPKADSPKAQTGCDSEQGSGKREVIERERREALRRRRSVFGLERKLQRRRVAIATLAREPEAR